MREPPNAPDRPRLLLITGISGSGKSTAANSLEDIGYYCVDNLPLPLLRTFLADPLTQVGSYRRIAVVTDVRAPGFAEAIPQLLSEIDRRRFELVVVFLDATEGALIRRFSETRRSHPLGFGDRPLIDGIRRERSLLAELRGAADLVFDTSDWSVHEFRRVIYREFGDEAEDGGAMVLSLVSFGFRHGIPSGSDLVFDVRFLTNPHFHPDLRELNGRDTPVRDFLEAQDDYRELISRLEDFLLFLLPRYRQENRSYLSVAVGCTGGRHRSVAVCERLAKHLADRGSMVRLNHRDVDR
ncbi:MAG: RNase adapter RapZ [bacterium]|nr:RNase adapter RapZ [bacterium]